jgi:hypothetical protein
MSAVQDALAAENFEEEEAPVMDETPIVQPLEEGPVVPALFSKSDGPSGLLESVQSMSMLAVGMDQQVRRVPLVPPRFSDLYILQQEVQSIFQSQSHNILDRRASSAPLGPILSARSTKNTPTMIIKKLQQNLGANVLQMEVATEMVLDLLVSNT